MVRGGGTKLLSSPANRSFLLCCVKEIKEVKVSEAVWVQNWFLVSQQRFVESGLVLSLHENLFTRGRVLLLISR